MIIYFKAGCEACKKAKMFYNSCLDKNKTLGKNKMKIRYDFQLKPIELI